MYTRYKSRVHSLLTLLILPSPKCKPATCNNVFPRESLSKQVKKYGKKHGSSRGMLREGELVDGVITHSKRKVAKFQRSREII